MDRALCLWTFAVALALVGCRSYDAAAPWPDPGVVHSTPGDIDHSGWVQVARLRTPESARKMLKVLSKERIPAWIADEGYPAYPLRVPPEYRSRVLTLLKQHGYEMWLSNGSE